MPDMCLDTNLHHNSGTSQGQRMLPALAADYAKVDERSTADLLLFAKKYGAYLDYYSEKNTVSGDWSHFMENDISMMIAYVQDWQKQDRDFAGYVTNLYDIITSSSTSPADVVKNFKYIFDLVFSIAISTNKVLGNLPGEADYAGFLNTAIASKLSFAASQLKDYYLFFLGPIFPAGSTTSDPLAPFDDIIAVPTDVTIFQSMFGFMTANPWQSSSSAIIPPATMFTGMLPADIVTNNFFTGAVTSFLNGITSLVNQTGYFLEKTLLNYPNHQPHYALYLSFLRLFRFAQDHLNEYTKRHLRFYYKKILQLTNDPGLPDTAHLVFALQKSFSQHLLKKGTLFKAGKDASNHELFYELTDEIVINQASVQDLKSLYIVKNYSDGASVLPQQLFASSIANSSDGQGGKLTSTDKSWYPFGDLSNEDFRDKTVAQIGFAIASNILFLNEGVRTITVTFNCTAAGNPILTQLSTAIPANLFSAKFTGNKKLFGLSEYLPDSAITVSVDTSLDQLAVKLKLSGNAPPVIPYSKKIHGGNFTRALPMIQLMLADPAYYLALKSLKISSIGLKVEVNGVKNLSLQNDAGKLDASKPFKLFGDFPADGTSFIIGSKEIFQKQLSLLTLNFAWQPGSDPSLVILSGLKLKEGNWDLSNPLSLTSDVARTTVGIATPSTNGIPQSPADFTSNENYTVDSIDGFIKLSLYSSPSNSYSLATYLGKISTAKTTVTQHPGTATDTDYTVTPPSPPASPLLLVVQSMNVNYSATDNISFSEGTADEFDARTNFFYHIEPFGFREMHPFLFTQPAEVDPLLPDNMLSLVPIFNMTNDSQDSLDNGKPSGHNNEGELWIGLNNAKSGEVHSLLFEVSEGSSNPLKKITKISWFYLSSNNWIALDPFTGVNDQTNSLSKSGLIIFNLPGDETMTNTRADNNLLWIKGVATTDTDSVCKIITVQANAAKAEFVIDAENKIFFTSNIAGGTISKPAIADAVLKQTTQPYASSGGTPFESDAQFNQRVSERLRHKHRAVSAWDYERLILQNFPQIHKVKCLNHTTIKPATQDYSEMKPGDVMIVTVPDFSLLTGANPLLPFTNVGLLEDIKQFIKTLCSPFVHVHVCNPQFEAIQFNFNVYFSNDNSNKSYYTQQLNTDIQKFLMPWAFGSLERDIEFGGKIEKSVVLDFVQRRPYVDFATCFEMLKYIYQEDGSFSSPTADADEAIASTARSILVPYSLNTISPTANCTCNGK